MRNDIVRYRQPSAVVAIAAVSVLSRAVEIEFAVSSSLRYHVRRFRFAPLSDIALRFGQPAKKVDLSHG
jgi:hypothetical protein